MRQKLLSVFLLCSMLISVVYAQNRQVSGKVTSAEDGSPISGVTVSVQGANIATQTDGSGNYSINAPANGRLSFRYVGYAPQIITIGTQSTINVQLVVDQGNLEEIVVTGAYGIRENTRSAPYGTQTIKSEALNVTRQPNLNNALAGQVTGLQVRSQSAAAIGRQTEVRLRGAAGFGAGNGAIYVVDGTILPNSDDINIDDIESVTVLQGPAAAAQFGSQGANGAIVITLKKAYRGEYLGIDLNLGTSFDKIATLPNYQNEYAGGSQATLQRYVWQPGQPEEWKALDGKYFHDYSDDASWGPRMVGQEYIPWYAWYGGHSRSYQTAKLDPQPDNAAQFFETGITSNNGLSISKGGDNYATKMSYTNQYVNGLLPGSSLNRNVFNINGELDLNEKLKVGANINYIQQRLSGEIDDNYSNSSTGSFNQWFHRDLDMGILKELRGLTTPDGIYATWNKANPGAYNPNDQRAFYASNFWYNPYMYYDMIDLNNQRDRLFGNVFIKYQVYKDLSFTATYRKQQNTTFWENMYRSELNESGLQTTGNNANAKGSYSTGNTFSNRNNFEFVASYNKKIDDFTVDANFVTDIFRAKSNENSGATVDGLTVDNLFTLSNSASPASQFNTRSQEGYNAVMVRGTLGYKDMLFGNFTLRNDWFSTLPEDDNSVLSKSFGASFVFSDLIKEDLPWLSYGKVRFAWGEIPQALGTGTSFGAYVYPGMAYGVGQFKWGDQAITSTPDRLVDPEIRGSVVSQKDLGLELKFLNDRIGLEFTYWDGSSIDFPTAISLNGASGYNSIFTNVGKIEKKGFEYALNANPFRNDSFNWNIRATLSDLKKNDVISISPKYDVTRINVGGVWGATLPQLVHEEGMRWGQIFGNGILRDDNGTPIIGADGLPENDKEVFFGSALPRFTGGVQNSFRYKDFSLMANIDWGIGGKFVSLSNMWGSYSGLTARTAGLNDKGNPVRDAVIDGGGIRVDGVDKDGNPITDNYVEAQDYFHGLYNKLLFDDYVYDLTFVKLRSVSIGYNIPVQKLSWSKFMRTANISVIANNPLLIYAKTKDFDPSEVSSVDGERGQLPATRGFGFNIRIGF